MKNKLKPNRFNPMADMCKLLEHTPVGKYMALVNTGMVEIDKSLIDNYADLIDLESSFYLDYRHIIYPILRYGSLDSRNFQGAMPSTVGFRYSTRLYLSFEQTSFYLIEKISILAKSNISLAREICSYIIKSIDSTLRIFCIIDFDVNELSIEKRLMDASKQFEKFYQKLSSNHFSNRVTERVDFSEISSSNAAAGVRKLVMTGLLDKYLDVVDDKCYNKPLAVAKLLLVFGDISPLSLAKVINSTFKELKNKTDAFNVSEATINRDIKDLSTLNCKTEPSFPYL